MSSILIQKVLLRSSCNQMLANRFLSKRAQQDKHRKGCKRQKKSTGNRVFLRPAQNPLQSIHTAHASGKNKKSNFSKIVDKS